MVVAAVVVVVAVAAAVAVAVAIFVVVVVIFVVAAVVMHIEHSFQEGCVTSLPSMRCKNFKACVLIAAGFFFYFLALTTALYLTSTLLMPTSANFQSAERQAGTDTCLQRPCSSRVGVQNTDQTTGHLGPSLNPT